VLAFDVEKAGKFSLNAALTMAVDYGIIRLSLDGKPLGEPIDLFNNGVITRVFEFGTHELSAGQHKLSAEITGANPKAVTAHMFGVDYIKLAPAN